jgi:hypothetical protein
MTSSRIDHLLIHHSTCELPSSSSNNPALVLV